MQFTNKYCEIVSDCPDIYRTIFGPTIDETILTSVNNIRNLIKRMCDSNTSDNKNIRNSRNSSKAICECDITGQNMMQLKRSSSSSINRSKLICKCDKSRCLCEIETMCTNFHGSKSKLSSESNINNSIYKTATDGSARSKFNRYSHFVDVPMIFVNVLDPH